MRSLGLKMGRIVRSCSPRTRSSYQWLQHHKRRTLMKSCRSRSALTLTRESRRGSQRRVKELVENRRRSLVHKGSKLSKAGNKEQNKGSSQTRLGTCRKQNTCVTHSFNVVNNNVRDLIALTCCLSLTHLFREIQILRWFPVTNSPSL